MTNIIRGGFLALVRRHRQKRRAAAIAAAQRENDEIMREPDARERFDRIYRQRIWSRMTNGRSVSGSGSNDRATRDFRSDIVGFLASRAGGTLFDTPCGDFFYMRRVTLPNGWTYVGGDIAPTLIADLRRKYPDRVFREFDVTRDPFPDYDVWLCRHLLFHLSFADIARTLTNFAQSACGVAIITNELGVHENHDIRTGLYRPLDLTLPPFRLPPPQSTLRDFSERQNPMIAGVWTRDQIASALAPAIDACTKTRA